MRKNKLIVGNWKMAPLSATEATAIFAGIRTTTRKLRKTDAVLCPPFLYAGAFAKKISGKRLSVGVQDVFWKDEGAYTGEISPRMLASTGVTHVIVGHSERRALGETDEAVSRKTEAALRADITPIICVGESERDEQGFYVKRIEEQLRSAFSFVSKKELSRTVIAYEPVWAIGARAVRAALPRDVEEVAILIKKIMASMFGREAANVPPILYGGSVDAKNCASFLTEGGADGLLVGRASLDPKQFAAILRVADTLPRAPKRLP